MNIFLKKATCEDSGQIHQMQLAAFHALLEKYRDFTTNPGAETLDRVKQRFASEAIDQYIITLEDESIGYIRIRHLSEAVYRLSQMFILPGYQNNGYAQAAILQAESFYPEARQWVLDTIKQETKLCHLYEKMGYTLTGTEKNIQVGMDLADYVKWS